ncbi:2-phospho-L-lactate guanylyltransferase [Glaciihabitans arcticus]|uniref:2-phospho-L-lactate guanylyltransferase n=1 Tax=Glaciihabitans arcticus TaxID=2668039 RepID=A0A4V2JEM1_9MICO|nr:2-phospho-L-lactate guanylyltransferase [Glaciihabitans arcticus]TBN56109.1 2-phospho-L-lactate guanylyltransferase [Glaciihabitans arcticus]
MVDWTIVIPVKGTVGAKSRLGASAALAEAIALDTIRAALEVAPVIVVTASTSVFAGTRIVADPGTGLNAAIGAGIKAADGPVAVLLGDLPALLPAELRAALDAASAHPRAFVPDAEGAGTVLLTSTIGHTPAFGQGSAQRHREAGYVELELPADSGLRRDVDTPEQLAGLGERLGAATRAALPPARH